MFENKDAQYKALVETFPRSFIKSRIQSGVELFYMPTEVIRDRLNSVFTGGAFDIRVGTVITSDLNVDLSCVLTLRWVDGSVTTIEEWGSADILMNKAGTSRVSDSYKAAHSDALKRCLAALGVAGELYHEEYRASLKEPLPPAENSSGTDNLKTRFSRRVKRG